MEMLSQFPGGRVLDVATGQGGFVQFLAENLRDYAAIVGIDTLTSGAAAFAEIAKDQPHVRLIQMDAHQMGLASASFDTVCISNSLHHMSDLPRVLAEMQRVLKPGGHYIVAEMYRDGQTETQLTHVLLHHWWAAVDTARGITHYETYPRQQILDLLDGLGLESLTVEDVRDLSGDPHDPDGIQYLEKVIDRYLARAAGMPNQAALEQRGEALRQRVRVIGVHGAASLLAVGRKP